MTPLFAARSSSDEASRRRVCASSPLAARNRFTTVFTVLFAARFRALCRLSVDAVARADAAAADGPPIRDRRQAPPQDS